MLKQGAIRAIALAIIKRKDGRFLVEEYFDSFKKEAFYRPLGGGIEFGEKAEYALKREFLEEINKEIEIIKLICSLENIFTCDGKRGHEIVMLYEARFKKVSDEFFDVLEIVENGQLLSKAVWKNLREIRGEKKPLYPDGLSALLQRKYKIYE